MRRHHHHHRARHDRDHQGPPRALLVLGALLAVKALAHRRHGGPRRHGRLTVDA